MVWDRYDLDGMYVCVFMVCEEKRSRKRNVCQWVNGRIKMETDEWIRMRIRWGMRCDRWRGRGCLRRVHWRIWTSQPWYMKWNRMATWIARHEFDRAIRSYQCFIIFIQDALAFVTSLSLFFLSVESCHGLARVSSSPPQWISYLPIHHISTSTSKSPPGLHAIHYNTTAPGDYIDIHLNTLELVHHVPSARRWSQCPVVSFTTELTNCKKNARQGTHKHTNSSPATQQRYQQATETHFLSCRCLLLAVRDAWSVTGKK